MSQKVTIDKWTRDNNENGKISHQLDVTITVDDLAKWESMSETERNQFILDRLAPDLGPGVRLVPSEETP